MLIKQMTVGYQNRTGVKRDYQSVSKITLANQFLRKSGFSIGDQITVHYLHNQIIITKQIN